MSGMLIANPQYATTLFAVWTVHVSAGNYDSLILMTSALTTRTPKRTTIITHTVKYIWVSVNIWVSCVG